MRYKIIIILLIIFTIISFTGCSFRNSDKNVQSEYKQIQLDEEQERNADIKTEKLQERIIQLRITIPAQFRPMTTRLDRIYAPISCRVVNVFVQIGDIVKIGQPLIQLNSDVIGQIQLEFLDKYITLDSEIKQMTAQYNLSVQNYKRENILYHEGISSRAEYQVAYAQMLKDKAYLDSLKVKKNAIIKVYAQRVALYSGSESTIKRVAVTKRIYPYITLCANKNGVILERKVNPGEMIEINRELINLADLSIIWLVGFAFEKDAPLLKVGQQVTGIFAEEKGRIVKGELSYVSSIIDTDRRTLDVIADIPNENLSIKPNVYAEMVVDVGTVNTLAVPNTALQKYGDYTFAYVKVAPNTFEERKVVVGQQNDKYSEVRSGLTLGEEIVSQGGFSLLGESIKMKEE